MTAPDGSRGAAPLLRASASMIATTVLTAGAGFAFWTVAARHWDTASVGHAAAALSAVAVVAVLSSQTVSASLLGRMPRAADAHGLLACGLVTTGSVALALAVVVRAGVVPAVPALASLRTPAMTALFLLVCVAHGVAATADAASVALRSSRVMTGRAAAHGFGKLAVVVAVAAIAPGVPATPALLGSWTALSIVTTARAAAVLLRLARSTSEPRDRRGSPWRELLRGSAAQTVAGVGGALPPQLLPLLVAARAG
ncbi:MAG TPA: hypothetical protein VHE83_11555, partial [Mycobacteriales bacterium]|nr:hypothetical protein [Mycobacteriales bacterium]